MGTSEKRTQVNQGGQVPASSAWASSAAVRPRLCAGGRPVYAWDLRRGRRDLASMGPCRQSSTTRRSAPATSSSWPATPRPASMARGHASALADATDTEAIGPHRDRHGGRQGSSCASAPLNSPESTAFTLWAPPHGGHPVLGLRALPRRHVPGRAAWCSYRPR